MKGSISPSGGFTILNEGSFIMRKGSFIRNDASVIMMRGSFITNEGIIIMGKGSISPSEGFIIMNEGSFNPVAATVRLIARHVLPGGASGRGARWHCISCEHRRKATVAGAQTKLECMVHYDTPGIAYDAPGLCYDGATPETVTITKMKKAKITLSSTTPDEVANIADGIIAAMTGNAAFPTPNPALAGVTTQTAAVRAKKLLITGLETDLATARGELKDEVGELKNNLLMLRDYVQAESDGDANLIHSAGMQIVGERTPVGPLPQVSNLKVSGTDAEGTLQAEWQPVYGAFTYLIETATNSEGPWTQYTAATRSRAALAGLTPGTKYWVRVRAVGAAGLGPYSDLACKIAA